MAQKPRCGHEYTLNVRNESMVLVCEKRVGHEGLHEAHHGIMAVIRWVDVDSFVKRLSAVRKEKSNA